MFEFVTQHQFWTAVVIYWIFSAAVSSMPDPPAGGTSGYLWLFRFLHSVAGNITTAFGSKIPGLKSLIGLLLVLSLFATTACASHYKAHPGALNITDSAAYATLLIAGTAIDQASLDYNAGNLPASAKPVLDTLIQSYNIARHAWLAYRGAIATNEPSEIYFDDLTKNVVDLTNAIRAFQEALGK
jgi:hypothetical protein